MNDLYPMRMVKLKEETYIHHKDIAHYLMDFASTETEDSRIRIEEAAQVFLNLESKKKNE